jgi:L-arabinose isomerase
MINCMKEFEFWFVTGSQNLYGEEVIEKVRNHAMEMVRVMDDQISGKLIFKDVMITPEKITHLIKEANYDDKCTGIITWMHTFSPSKMWINGLKILNKPMLHLHTQYNREIPFDNIDMDFININQSAHGDREHGFICTRLRIPRKVVAGYWRDKKVMEEISNWMRSAAGVVVGRFLKVVRFADNMREVAVTEGDKVEAQIKLGWSVNSLAMGDLVAEMDKISIDEIDEVFKEIKEKYDIVTDKIDAIKYQIRIWIALKKICQTGGFDAFVTCFENLYGMEQLPGLACQLLMEQGYGFGPEGDWKTAALMRLMKVMEMGLPGGLSFIEDYTYHLKEKNELILGAHMLEVDPSIADGKIRIDVQPLGIGGKSDPARMIFEGHAGDAIMVSLVDMGGRMRLIVADVEAVKPMEVMPKLPVASVMWKLLPDFETGVKAWIYAGGAHHSVLSYSLNSNIMRDFAEMVDIEFVHIGKGIDINVFKKDLILADQMWKIK